MTNKIIKRSLAIIILSGTFIFTGANQAGEAKTYTLNQTSNVAQSVMSEIKFKIVKLPVEKIQQPEIEPIGTEPSIDVYNYKSMSVTAFTSGFESTQKKKGQKGYGITASGEPVKQGVTAACPKSMSFGTEIYIKELDHVYTCQDRGEAIKEGHIDIYFNDLREARHFGRQKLSVAIID
ncbi:3D domain-containing protein [Paenibacillus sp. FSL H7-0331]|nr:3D domain-containing protein [Paenibacillus sp. FSL H7-0331]